MIKVDRIGLVNLVAEKKIVPELIQNEVKPERISEETLNILKNPHRFQKMKDELSKVRFKLGEPGASARAARIITSLLP
jgi:lipid-A-disaccharide synthase